MSVSTPPLFPLSAVAHQPQLVLALSLLAVSPDIGGVLIRGDRGAAKSTAARGLAALLPGGGPFVNLPLGATEDRIVGSLNLEAALAGEARLQPGLLAQANGGVLYIDEVNLLPDHLVDLLLDAAAMGMVRVQRDSLSAELSAHFALIGSMNPEEGPLRPQFLDRFGLCVDVQAPLQAQQRADIVGRRMAYEADPAAFVQQWQGQEQHLKERLSRARTLLAGVGFPAQLLETAAYLSLQAGVRSLRADLVMYRAARALCALEGREVVTEADLQVVAELVLRHRQDPRQPPIQPPEAQNNPSPPTPNPDPPQNKESAPTEPSSPPPPTPPDNTPAQEADAQDIATPMQEAPALPLQARQRSGAGGQRPAKLVGTVSDPTTSTIHLGATVRAAALRQVSQATPSTSHWQPQDLQRPLYAPTGQRRVLFVADTSGSVGLSGRMGAIKGMMLEALQTPHTQVALMVFRATGAELSLDWTDDTVSAKQAISNLPTGGRTPLAHALQLAQQLLSGVRGAELVLFTDGRANVPLQAGHDAWADTLSAAQGIHAQHALVIDTETGHVKLGRAQQLAQVMGATVLSLEELLM